jgi:hypothetical protein
MVFSLNRYPANCERFDRQFHSAHQLNIRSSEIPGKRQLRGKTAAWRNAVVSSPRRRAARGCSVFPLSAAPGNSGTMEWRRGFRGQPVNSAAGVEEGCEFFSAPGRINSDSVGLDGTRPRRAKRPSRPQKCGEPEARTANPARPPGPSDSISISFASRPSWP